MPHPLLKLYESQSSPNSRRVRIFLAEKAIDIELIPVDIAAKAQFSPEYTTINPLNVVPTLMLEDGTSVGEVPAIWRYLEEVYPDKPLLGVDPKDKALVAMWERWAEREGFATVMEAVRNWAPGLAGRALAGPHAYEQIPALVKRNEARLGHFYRDLNKRLETVAYLAGDQFSVADITAVVAIDFAVEALELDLPEDLPALRTWYATVSVRWSLSA
ncbi:glutathione S-transferase family protein [Pseudomonas sp. CCI3.2]|uniref:glutathione S-transferase family protein n=1 Tax=unclassified Pseudomonas TaxID=196821 RepID=UPI002AC8AD88|nr:MULTISPECIES: glutathione S-transferase family protein [unclassified Pseudomonas]MEB0079385.1 glutathione S-transferase family protein [Pseudomonas sp. MH10out]MEB0092014.1 glutathione S-transferase family protein [Pseudomonas sp. CCI4.2]MEB0104288.1 glutathione S-transferase family protein [Pseudomonas sp. CCI3.2]MEB0123278.1 glutathione S-transferase family protein [Pseudomonas sp. CCI1.2]MEB0132416.1 glutathione S-transferase family protein [Pseudomonas sp. CCI2.4]